MRYAELGGAGGLRVSAFCLGALPFGTTVDETTAYEILDWLGMGARIPALD